MIIGFFFNKGFIKGEKNIRLQWRSSWLGYFLKRVDKIIFHKRFMITKPIYTKFFFEI